MVNRRIVLNLLKANGYGLFIAGVIFILGISWLIPPQENTFVLQRRLQEIWIVLLGIISMPFSLTILHNTFLLAFITILGVALLYGAIAQFVGSAHWPNKLLLVTMFCLNCVVGYVLLSFGVGDGVLYSSDPRVSCEHFTSASDGVRISEYLQGFSDGGAAQYFYLSTQDGGKGWSQIGSAKYGYGISSCWDVNTYGTTGFDFYTCEPENVDRRPPACALGGALMDQ